MKKKDFLDRKYINACVIGFELAGSVTVGLLIGMFLDKKFETKPIFTLVFFLLGLAAGVRSFYRFYKKSLRSMEEESETEQDS